MRRPRLVAIPATVADLFQYTLALGNRRLAEVTEVGDELGVVLFVPPMLPLALVRNPTEGRAVMLAVSRIFAGICRRSSNASWRQPTRPSSATYNTLTKGSAAYRW